MIVLYAKDEDENKYFCFAFQYIEDDPIDRVIQNYNDYLTVNVWFVPGTVDF